MSPPARWTRARRRGASAVEFALVMPAFTAMMYGIFEYSWYFSRELAVMRASQAGARLGAFVAPDDDPSATAEAETRRYLAGSGVDPSAVTVTSQIISGATGELILVDTTLDYKPLVGLLPTPKQLVGTASATYEGELY